MSSYSLNSYNSVCIECNKNAAAHECNICGITLCNMNTCCNTFVNNNKPDTIICNSCVNIIDNKLIENAKQIIAGEIGNVKKFSVNEIDYCVGCNKKQRIMCCSKCGDAVCIRDTCSTIFENHNKPSTILCKECVDIIEKKFVLYDLVINR